MELNTQRIAWSVALTLAMVYTVFMFFAALTPGAVGQLLNWMAPIVSPDKFVNANMTFGGYVFGLIQIFVYSYLITWIFGAVHNSFVRSEIWSASGERAMRRAHA